MSKEKLSKQENGSIAVFAIAAVFSLIFILGGVFAASTANRKNQLRTLLKIKEVYLEEPEKEAIQGEWTQDKTSVTNGTVTLEVGQAVKGYTANGVGDGKWFVLGAKDGKLLITTNSNQGTVTLEGQDGYANGVSKLNTEGAKFNDGNMAELARSINVEDINRVTGYAPDVANYNNGNNVDQWKNEVTYTLNADGKIHYQGTKYPTTDTASTYPSFTYWNGSNWIPLENETEKNSITLTHDYYYYYPQTLSTDDSKASETTINGSTSAYTLLFANTSSSTTYYWLSSQLLSSERRLLLLWNVRCRRWWRGRGLFVSLVRDKGAR